MILSDSIARFSVAISLAVAVPPALAENAEPGLCEGIGQLAEQIMLIRQKEAPISDVMKAVVPEGNAEAADLVRNMILAAYEQPAMKTPDNQKDQVARFRNIMEFECYSATADQ